MELYIIDMETSITARRTRKDCTPLAFNDLNVAYNAYFLGEGLSYQLNSELKWIRYATSACKSSGIAPEVLRCSGY